MRYLKTGEAAKLLSVTSTTLRAWESRFGFPAPTRSAGNQRMYRYGEVVALRGALRDCVSISAAVRRAREELVAGDASLVAALGGFDRGAADRAMETALESRSLQRCVEGLLVPALERIARERGLDSAGWAFAASWGGDWLRRATRLGVARMHPLSIVLGDASRDELDPDAPHIRALELFSVRAGVNLMTLSVRGVAGIGDALRAQRPDVVVIAGDHGANDTVATWARSVRLAVGPTPIALYRRAGDFAAVPTTGTTVLPTRASDAHHRLVDLITTTHAPVRIGVLRYPLGRLGPGSLTKRESLHQT